MALEGPPAPYPDHINKYLVKVDGDIVFVRYFGSFAPDEARAIMSLMDQVYNEQGRVYFMGDVSQVEIPGPKTRRVFAQWKHPGRFMTGAYFGASWSVRAIAALIDSTMRLILRKSAFTYYCKTEAEARAWLSEQRRAQAQ